MSDRLNDCLPNHILQLLYTARKALNDLYTFLKRESNATTVSTWEDPDENHELSPPFPHPKLIQATAQLLPQ